MTAITGPLVKINGTILPKLADFKVGRNKLWTDSGRNLNGDLFAIFLGVYPKLELKFATTTKAEMALLVGLLDQASFTAAWYDELTGVVQSATYYAGDYEYAVFSKPRGLYQPFNVDLIPFKRYT